MAVYSLALWGKDLILAGVRGAGTVYPGPTWGLAENGFPPGFQRTMGVNAMLAIMTHLAI